MNILTIITVDLATGAKRQHEIDHDLKASRIWLARHASWALNNSSAILTLPKKFAPDIFLAHSKDIGDIDSVSNL